MDLNHRCLGVGQESLPLDHGTVLQARVESRKETAGDGPGRAALHPRLCFLSSLLCTALLLYSPKANGLTGSCTRISGLQDRRLPLGR
jgi:hypothetical protein